VSLHRYPCRVLLAAFLLGLLAYVGRAEVVVEEATVADLQAAYLKQETRSREVVAAYLARIEAYDQRGPRLHSIINLNPKALEEAEALDARLAATGQLTGPLHGIPVLVKDCIDAVGMPATGGFQGWKNYYPPSDAPLVARLKSAGAIILGKASLSEFTRGGGDNINSIVSGFCRNPYNTAFASGGSSGGTGASIAANFAMLGVGTDTGGSIRMPSAHNALVGLRPTVGLISRTGIVPNNSIRDTAGPMTRTVTDLAVMLDAMAGADPADAATARAAGHIPTTYTAALKTNALRGARLAVLRQAFRPKVTDPRIIAHFEGTLAELKAAGAEIVDDFSVPVIDDLPRAPQTPARRKDDMIRFLAVHPGIPYASPAAIAESKLAHPLHQSGLEADAAAGPVETDEATLKGLETEAAYRKAFTEAMDARKIDAVVFPVWAQLPALNGDRNTRLMTSEPDPKGGVTALSSSLTFVGSTLQWPALSVPSGYLGEGLPQGLQILGRAWDEARIISYAFAYEQATRHRRPPASTPPLADSLASRFIGTWKLHSIRDRDPVTGVETPAARAGRDGQLVYAANGRLSVQIIREGRDSAPAGSSDGFSSYFGTWKLVPSEKYVLHQQDGNLNTAQTGQAAKRYYAFDAEGRLALTTPPRRRDGETKETQSVLVWTRIP
jgi:amidase